MTTPDLFPRPTGTVIGNIQRPASSCFALSGFDSLLNVEFRNSRPGAFVSAPGVGIDTIDLTSVP
jgi:hypothetical protein